MNGERPHGLTIVDSRDPVKISSDAHLDIRGGEPRVAYWTQHPGEQTRIIRHDDFGRVMMARDQDDAQASEAVRRVFKWAPVMRLALASDPAALREFVRQLARVRIIAVKTPRLLVEE
jgi:hypothetical protein